DRYERLHHQPSGRRARGVDCAADADLHLGRQPRTRLCRAHLGGYPCAARLPPGHERRRHLVAAAPGASLVEMEDTMSVAEAIEPDAIAPAVEEPGSRVAMAGEKVSVFYGAKQALFDVDLEIERHRVTSLIGPSGCGQSTFLRCLNRMNDTIESCRVTGKITLDGEDIYDKSIDVVELRARVGMVFQKPNPFPKSIYENVAYGPRIHGLAHGKAELDEVVVSS